MFVWSFIYLGWILKKCEMGLYFSAAAQDCRLLFSRVIVTWLFNSGGWFKTSIAHELPWAKMADFKSAGSCTRQTSAVEMNVNANGWLSPDILQTSSVTPETGSLPTTFIFHGSFLVPLQVFSSSFSSSCWNEHCLSLICYYSIFVYFLDI